jgi:hypothetical protein
VIAGDIQESASFSGAFFSPGCFCNLLHMSGEMFLQIPAHSFETFFRFVHYTLGSTHTPR